MAPPISPVFHDVRNQAETIEDGNLDSIATALDNATGKQSIAELKGCAFSKEIQLLEESFDRKQGATG